MTPITLSTNNPLCEETINTNYMLKMNFEYIKTESIICEYLQRQKSIRDYESR